MPGIDAWPLRPCTRTMNGADIFSAVAHRYTGVPPMTRRSPPPSLTRVVAADRVRMRFSRASSPNPAPTSSSATTMSTRSPDGDEALARERCEGDGAGRDLILHVERTAAPHLAVDEVARPGIAIPLGGIGEHRVGVREEARATARRHP